MQNHGEVRTFRYGSSSFTRSWTLNGEHHQYSVCECACVVCVCVCACVRVSVCSLFNITLFFGPLLLLSFLSSSSPPSSPPPPPIFPTSLLIVNHFTTLPSPLPSGLWPLPLSPTSQHTPFSLFPLLPSSHTLLPSSPESYHLCASPNVTLHSCCFSPLPHSTKQFSRVFLYCAKNTPPKQSSAISSSMSSFTSTSSSYSHQIVLRKCEIAPNGSLVMGQSSVLLESCPPLDFVSFRDGVCFLPCQDPYPQGLLLFWAPSKLCDAITR